MHPLYSVAEIRGIEHLAAQRLPEGALMQRAGQAGANAALDLLPFSTSRARVLVLAGPGNNGGDALETAAHLAHAGAQVTLMHFAPNGEPSPERAAALFRARHSAVTFADLSLAEISGGDWSLVIDGLFGIGLGRPLEGAMAILVSTINQLGCPLLALDVPSGLDADRGCVIGANGIAVRATHTVTFIGNKPGLHTCDGRDHAGLVQINNLDLEASLFPTSRTHLNDVKLFARHIHSRRHNSHKGSFGNVAVLGGANGMVGAPVLAGRTALLTGAGRVYLCFAGEALPYDSGQPELMCRSALGFDFDSAIVVAGPGLGTSSDSRAVLALAASGAQALVLDADALNIMAEDSALCDAIAQRSAETVLTPHPLEAARLLRASAASVQSDRLRAARELASRFKATVILKGSGTVLASPRGDIVINNTGNPGLATAGTGDVLAGLCGSLLAQGWPGWEAALGAVWLHGMAADVLVTEGTGPIGLTASELVPAIRVALNRMVEHHGR